MTGKVILAGAGPGDAELITVKLQKRLAEADVIISDRLVNPAIAETYARKDAQVILAGKEGYNEASASQVHINQLIVKHALDGKTVLRLKGGDIAFFSNVLDELQSITALGLEFEIIPGITAASGASAYTGIPLTARSFAQGVQFHAYNPKSNYTPEIWQQLSSSEDTLVFYMGVKNIDDLTAKLLMYSKSPSTPMAIIEQATTPYQKVHITTLEDAGEDLEGISLGSPSIIIIGEVVNLHSVFNWYQSKSETGDIFHKLINTNEWEEAEKHLC